jgi:hypothetical protein
MMLGSELRGPPILQHALCDLTETPADFAFVRFRQRGLSDNISESWTCFTFHRSLMSATRPSSLNSEDQQSARFGVWLVPIHFAEMLLLQSFPNRRRSSSHQKKKGGKQKSRNQKWHPSNSNKLQATVLPSNDYAQQDDA